MTTKKTTSKAKTKTRAVLVTTQHRGVFFGMATKTTGETIELTDVRNILYWPQECKGFLGLAADGPKTGAKLGPAAQRVELRNITSVTDLSEASAKVFAEFPVWR